MGMRGDRRAQRQDDQKTSRRINGVLKKKERARRDARMMGLIKTGKVPFIPAVTSWLSERLNKPGHRITQADVDGLLKG